jgi:hypothetical protein
MNYFSFCADVSQQLKSCRANYTARSGFPQCRQFTCDLAVMEWQVGHMVCDWWFTTAILPVRIP